MASWNDLLTEFIANSDPNDPEVARHWLTEQINDALKNVRTLRRNRNVILYGSAFLQKPAVPNYTIAIAHEDLNGLMSVIHGMDCNLGLSLILHTPGGQTNAVESFVSYLHTKFTDIEVIVPAFAMSAGTMISLSADRIVMGRQSQLGPIDPQMQLANGGSISARAVTEQFDRAQTDILGTLAKAHVWASILQSLGPSLLQEAQNALDYSETMVARWLAKGMFKNANDPDAEGKRVAHHFNDASTHKSHGRRIDRDEAKLQGVVIEDLEAEQTLQDAILTVYHLMTIMFSNGQTTKVFWSDAGQIWAKNWTGNTP
jgi:ClpP class serine protease